MADHASHRSSTINQTDEATGMVRGYLDSTKPSDEKANIDPYLIDSFEEGDPSNPKVSLGASEMVQDIYSSKNWSRARRWFVPFFAYSLTVFSGTSDRYLTALSAMLVLNACVINLLS